MWRTGKIFGAHTIILTVGHLNKDCYLQQSESANLDSKKIWRNYHKSGSHPDDGCHHQRNGSRNSPTDNKSAKYKTFIADSNVTGCDKCSCNQKVEKKYTEIKDEPNTPPGIGFSFAM